VYRVGLIHVGRLSDTSSVTAALILPLRWEFLQQHRQAAKAVMGVKDLALLVAIPSMSPSGSIPLVLQPEDIITDCTPPMPELMLSNYLFSIWDLPVEHITRTQFHDLRSSQDWQTLAKK
jgi:hypothetical protein